MCRRRQKRSLSDCGSVWNASIRQGTLGRQIAGKKMVPCLDMPLGMAYSLGMTNYRIIRRTMTAALTGAALSTTVLLFGASHPQWDHNDTPIPVYSAAEEMLAAHDCWTGQGPEGVIPGHVVATKSGDATPTYGGPALTGKALDQLFAGKDVGLRVHGFCR